MKLADGLYAETSPFCFGIFAEAIPFRDKSEKKRRHKGRLKDPCKGWVSGSKRSAQRRMSEEARD